MILFNKWNIYEKGPDYVQSTIKRAFDLAMANGLSPVQLYVRFLVANHLRGEREEGVNPRPLVTHEARIGQSDIPFLSPKYPNR